MGRPAETAGIHSNLSYFADAIIMKCGREHGNEGNGFLKEGNLSCGEISWNNEFMNAVKWHEYRL